MSVRGARKPKISQLVISVIGMVAWVAIFNHCALGALAAKPVSHCHQTPVKHGQGEQMPCCKVLQAVTAPTKAAVGYDAFDFKLTPYPFSLDLLSGISRHHTYARNLDTGPPFVTSFSESVLQRSILAHAPPLSLS